jgi:hypothetical protein
MRAYYFCASFLGSLLLASVAFADCPSPGVPLAPTKACNKKCQDAAWNKREDELTACLDKQVKDIQDSIAATNAEFAAKQRVLDQQQRNIDARRRALDDMSSAPRFRCYPDSGGGQTCYAQ